MKRIILLFITILFLSGVSNAQTEKISGSWLMTKVEIGNDVEEPLFITDFNKDGSVEVMGMEVGSWEFLEKENKIIMKSNFDKDFSGEGEIVKLNEKELILIKDGAKLFYSKINQEKINITNETSGLRGVWRMESPDHETKLLKFELPDTFQQIIASDGVSESVKGTWIYMPAENAVLIISFSREFKGKYNIKKLSSDDLELENNDVIIRAKKEKIDSSRIERLTFEYEDFPEEINGEYELPWKNFGEMVSFLSNIKSLKYRQGTLIEEMNSFKYTTIVSTLEVDIDEQNIMFTNLFVSQSDSMQYSQNYKGGLSERYNDFFPKNELGIYRILGIENVEVPAGSFYCTVIEGLDGDSKVKYWMINNKPGVYAKIIKEGEGMFGDLEYLVFELDEIY